MDSQTLNKIGSKPGWLRTKIPGGERLFKTKQELEKRGLHTICQSARCPNISTCWNQFHATFLILGETCTRNCGFCSVPHGVPQGISPAEIGHVLQMIEIMKLEYVVITSVTRDDLADGGSSHYGELIRQIKAKFSAKVEILIPDFQNKPGSLQQVFSARPDVIGHNIETVFRLYPDVNRSPSNYQRSLSVLKSCREKGFITKSGVMVGLGETKTDLLDLFRDLRSYQVDLLTIGQYLQPTRENVPVAKYYAPEEFEKLKMIALDLGFKAVQAGPLVRSSFRARHLFQKALSNQ